MALLALFARATGRTYDAIRALVVVFVSMLLFSPLELVYDPGFQFSFAATLGLIIFSTPLQMRLLWVRGRVLREVVATTLAAQLFVLPLLLYQTGNLSLIAVPANILVLPSIPFAMAASAIAGIAGLAFPTASVVIALPAYALLSYVIGMAEFFAHLPFAHLIIPAFPAVLLVPAYLGIGWLVRQLQKTAPKGKPPPVLFLAKKLNRSVSRLNHAPVHIF
jgi:competence protein ComEC